MVRGYLVMRYLSIVYGWERLMRIVHVLYIRHQKLFEKFFKGMEVRFQMRYNSRVTALKKAMSTQG